MKATINKTEILNNSTNRVNNYVAKLKHGSSFKFVKGIPDNLKTLMSICLDRQKNGEFLSLNQEEANTFGLGYKIEKEKKVVMVVDVNYKGKLTVYPLETI